VKRDADTFTVRDLTGNDTVVRLTDRTSVKTKGGFLRSGTNYGQTNILRGLNLEVDGHGGSSGELVADSVRFNETDFRTARAVESRATPLEERASASEGRISEVEQNAQKLSGQLDELAAVSNAARGGAKAAQETADSAVAGVNATNDRISALDDYVPQETTAVNFRTGSAELDNVVRGEQATSPGFMRCACTAVLDFAFAALRTRSVYLNVLADNRRAIGLYRKLGFAESGRRPLVRQAIAGGYRLVEAELETGEATDLVLVRMELDEPVFRPRNRSSVKS